jgi:hypothetical protein
MSLINLSAAQLRQAASLKEQIEQLHEQLGQLIGTPSSAPKAKATKVKDPANKVKAKRVISPAVRAKMAAAAKARWAKINAAKKK